MWVSVRPCLFLSSQAVENGILWLTNSWAKSRQMLKEFKDLLLGIHWKFHVWPDCFVSWIFSGTDFRSSRFSSSSSGRILGKVSNQILCTKTAPTFGGKKTMCCSHKKGSCFDSNGTALDHRLASVLPMGHDSDDQSTLDSTFAQILHT